MQTILHRSNYLIDATLTPLLYIWGAIINEKTKPLQQVDKLRIEPLELSPLVRAAEVDFRNKLKLSSLFLLMQETAIRHVDQYNIGIG